MAWTSIRYRDFYDIPRAFVVERRGHAFFFDCAFDELIDDYLDRYRVYRLASKSAQTLDTGSWEGLAGDGTFVGELPASAVRFDDTKRTAIDDSVFDLIPGLSSPSDRND